MKTYVTFGQVHTHSVNGKTFDKDCVAVIEAEDYSVGRDKAFEYFGRAFAFAYSENEWTALASKTAYSENEWTDERLKYFPRGYIPVEGSTS